MTRIGRKRKIAWSAKANKARDDWLRLARAAACAFARRYNRRSSEKLTFNLDDVRVLDSILEANFKECKLTRQQIEALGLDYGELMRLHIGGVYQPVRQERIFALRCEGVIAFPTLRILKALRERKPGALEAYLFTFARLVGEKRAKRRKT